VADLQHHSQHLVTPSSNETDKPRQGVVANMLKLYRNGAIGSSAWLGCIVSNRQEEDWLVASEVDGASGETASGHNDAETRSAMMYHAVKITNNVRPDTRDVSLALHHASQTIETRSLPIITRSYPRH